MEADFGVYDNNILLYYSFSHMKIRSGHTCSTAADCPESSLVSVSGGPWVEHAGGTTLHKKNPADISVLQTVSHH